MSYMNFPTSVLTDRRILVKRQPSEVTVVVVIFPVVLVAVVVVRKKN